MSIPRNLYSDDFGAEGARQATFGAAFQAAFDGAKGSARPRVRSFVNVLTLGALGLILSWSAPAESLGQVPRSAQPTGAGSGAAQRARGRFSEYPSRPTSLFYTPGDPASADPDRLTRRLDSALRRCRRPESPGTRGGRPSLAEVESLSAELLIWKGEAERLLQLPEVQLQEQTPPARQTGQGLQPVPAGMGMIVERPLTELSNLEKHRLIQLYFSNLVKLALIRADFSLPNGSRFTSDYALNVTEELAGMEFRLIPDTREPTREIPAGFSQLFTVHRRAVGALLAPVGAGALGQNNGRASAGNSGIDYQLELSHFALRGIELARLSDDPSGPNQLRLVQVVAISSLIRTLNEVKTLRTDHRVGRVRLAPSFVAEMRDFGALEALEHEELLIQREMQFRLKLMQLLRENWEQIPDAGDADMVLDFFRVSGARINDSSVPVRLREALRRPTLRSLQESLSQGPIPLSSLTEREIRLRIRRLLQDAAMARFYGVLNQALRSSARNERPNGSNDGDDSTPDLEIAPGASYAMGVAYLDRRFEAFGAAIPESFLERVVSTACAGLGDYSDADGMARQWVAQLLSQSLSIADHSAAVVGGQRVVPALLWQMLEPELNGRGLRPGLVNELKTLFVQSSTLGELRSRYYGLAVGMTGLALIDWQNDRPVFNSDRVSVYLRTHDFSPTLERPANMPLAMHAQRVQAIREARIADLRSILWIGRELNFDGPMVRTSESELANWNVRQLFSNPARVSSYSVAAQAWFSGQNHLLYTSVRDLGGETTLARALARLQRAHGRSSERLITEARSLVDQALSRLETSTLRSIEQVSAATRLQELGELLRGNGMRRTLTQEAPSIAESITDYVSRTAHLDPLTLAVESLVSKIAMPQLALLATQIAVGGTHWLVRRLTRSPGPNPWLAPISLGLGSVMGAFVEGALGTAILRMFIADIGFQTYRFYDDQWAAHGLADEIAATSTTASQTLVSRAEAERERARFRVEATLFVGARSLDALGFLGLPAALAVWERASSVRTVAGGRLDGQRFLQDVADFEAIGVAPGRWEAIPRTGESLFAHLSRPSSTGGASGELGVGQGASSAAVAGDVATALSTSERLMEGVGAWLRLQAALREGNGRIWSHYGIGPRRIQNAQDQVVRARERMRQQRARETAENNGSSAP